MIEKIVCSIDLKQIIFYIFFHFIATKVCEKLHAVISTCQMKKDIPMLSTNQQTSELEAYHSVINHFAPKMIGFSYHGMQSRYVSKYLPSIW